MMTKLFLNWNSSWQQRLIRFSISNTVKGMKMLPWCSKQSHLTTQGLPRPHQPTDFFERLTHPTTHSWTILAFYIDFHCLITFNFQAKTPNTWYINKALAQYLPSIKKKYKRALNHFVTWLIFKYWEMFEQTLLRCLKVTGSSLEGLWKLYVGCLEGISERCLEGE